MIFDFGGSSPPCRGPMNSVLATTHSSVYLAMRHIFPEVPISAGAFEPLEIVRPKGTFLDAHYPRPVSGCAAEVSQRIAEAVFAALVEALPDRVTAAPAGTSGNNPDIHLKKGQTYYFRNTSSGHPFRIQSTTGTGGTAYNTGVTDNNASGPNGVIVFHVPMDAPSTLYYQCTSHTNMVGNLNIT